MNATLLRAAQILEAPNAWTQGEYARDEHGNTAAGVEPSDSKAVCWCAAGAIYKAHHEVTGIDLSDNDTAIPKAIRVFAKYLGWTPSYSRHPVEMIADINDHQSTKATKMIDRLKEAAAL